MTSSIAGLSAILILAGIIFSVFGIKYKKKEIIQFSFGFFAYFLAMLSEAVIMSGVQSKVLQIAVRTFGLLNAYFFLNGAYICTKSPLPKVWTGLIITAFFWVIFAVFTDQPFQLMTLPVHTVISFATLFCGIVFLKNTPNRSKYLAFPFILWAVHRFNYPFLRNVDWFAPWGFEIAKFLVISISMGLMYTFLKMVEREKAFESRKYETVFDTSPELLFIVDFNTAEILDTNKRACDLLGYSKEKIKTMKPWDITVNLKEEDIERERDVLRKNRIFSGEFSIKTKDGKVMPVDIKAVTVDKQTVLVSMREITELKKVYKIIEDNEKRFRTLFNSMLEVIIFCERESEQNKNFYIKDANKNFENTFGVSANNIVGKSFLELKDTFDFIDISFFPAEVNEYVAFCSYSENSDRFFRTAYIPVGETQFALSILDITTIVKAERGRRAIEERLIQIQKLESMVMMAGGIAHDFNNLLTGVLGNCELAKMSLDKYSVEYKYLSAIEKSALAAAELSKLMLAYSGKGFIDRKPFSLNRILEEMKPVLLSSVSKKVSLNFIPSKEDLIIEGDISQIKQIILNLVINASEAIGDNLGTVASFVIKTIYSILSPQMIYQKVFMPT